MSTNSTLAGWAQELAAVQERAQAAGAQPGVARPDQVLGNSGLQIMQAMLAGELPYPHIMRTLDYAQVQVDKGRAVFQGRPQLMHYNPLGSVHGGWYATLLDSALGCAVHTMLDPGQSHTTAELGIHIGRGVRAQRAAACDRQRRALWAPVGDGRSPHRRRRRQAVRAWQHHLPGVRRADPVGRGLAAAGPRRAGLQSA